MITYDFDMKTTKLVLLTVLVLGVVFLFAACTGAGNSAGDSTGGVPEFKLFYFGESPIWTGTYETTAEIALANGDVMLFDFYDASDSIDIDADTYNLTDPNLYRIFIWEGAEFESTYLKSVTTVDTVADSLYTAAAEYSADFNSTVPGSLTKINDATVTVARQGTGAEATYTFTWSCNSGAITGTYTGAVVEVEDMSAR